jgi:hypothetical protein
MRQAVASTTPHAAHHRTKAGPRGARLIEGLRHFERGSTNRELVSIRWREASNQLLHIIAVEKLIQVHLLESREVLQLLGLVGHLRRRKTRHSNLVALPRCDASRCVLRGGPKANGGGDAGSWRTHFSGSGTCPSRGYEQPLDKPERSHALRTLIDCEPVTRSVTACWEAGAGIEDNWSACSNSCAGWRGHYVGCSGSLDGGGRGGPNEPRHAGIRWVGRSLSHAKGARSASQTGQRIHVPNEFGTAVCSDVAHTLLRSASILYCTIQTVTLYLYICEQMYIEDQRTLFSLFALFSSPGLGALPPYPATPCGCRHPLRGLAPETTNLTDVRTNRTVHTRGAVGRIPQVSALPLFPSRVCISAFADFSHDSAV